jgi:peptidoglycan/xylan/chitin deacetylase (PgdA/CDA1 family)
MALAGAAPKPDLVTGFPKEVHEQKEWMPGKKVAVCFILYVEVWGFGQGPVFRPDMASRNPDLVNEAFRRYAIDFGIERTGSVFQEEDIPFSIALSAQFPAQEPEAWARFRAVAPKCAILAHGMNNSSAQLPMGRGVAEQEAYIKKTLDMIEKETGVRPRGWSSPSVYNNADTFRACAASGLAYTLDSMDSDYISFLQTPEGKIEEIPYPPVTVDMGQYLGRNREPEDMEKLWINYVTELSIEADKHPERNATIVAIGLHPFVVGSPNGASALRRTLETLKKLPNVWVTDTESISQVSNPTTK